jgi:hypothetical protein
MQPSMFTPIDLWCCSSEKPLAETIFDQQAAGLGGQFATGLNTEAGAICYANAINVARARHVVDGAAMQRLPTHASWLLPWREEEYEIVPAPRATMEDRRAEYASRFKVIESTNYISTEAALQEALGDAFVAYRVTPIDEIVTLSQADGLDINYQRPEVERKIIQLEDAVSFVGVPSTVGFSLVKTAGDPRGIGSLVKGDVLMVEPGRLGRSERIVVASITTHEPKTLTATFQLTHDAGVLGLTHPYPGWATNKRYSIIVLASTAAAIDPENRRRVDQVMRLYARSVSQWGIAAADGDNIQQFQIGVPSIGISTVEQFAISP